MVWVHLALLEVNSFRKLCSHLDVYWIQTPVVVGFLGMNYCCYFNKSTLPFCYIVTSRDISSICLRYPSLPLSLLWDSIYRMCLHVLETECKILIPRIIVSLMNCDHNVPTPTTYVCIWWYYQNRSRDKVFGHILRPIINLLSFVCYVCYVGHDWITCLMNIISNTVLYICMRAYSNCFTFTNIWILFIYEAIFHK